MPISGNLAVACLGAALLFYGAVKVGHAVKVVGRETKHVVMQGILHKHPPQPK